MTEPVDKQQTPTPAPTSGVIPTLRRSARPWPGPRFLPGEHVLVLFPGDTKWSSALIVFAPADVTMRAYELRRDGALDGLLVEYAYENAIKPVE